MMPSSSFTPPQPPAEASSSVRKKKAFCSSALCGLCCAFSDPSSAGSSANREETRPNRRRTKKIKKEVPVKPPLPVTSVARVESVGGHSHGSERVLTERRYSGRGGSNLDQRFSMDDPFPSFEASPIPSDPMPAWLYQSMRRYYHHHHVELEEIMHLHHRVRPGRGLAFDRYSDMRLDVDNMTYEDLLDLGDKIGYVNTGLNEEEIASSIVKTMPSLATEIERKCSICQEEYEKMDEAVGKLGCGHGFHIDCIKKWLLHKNACPVCKVSIISNALRLNNSSTQFK